MITSPYLTTNVCPGCEEIARREAMRTRRSWRAVTGSVLALSLVVWPAAYELEDWHEELAVTREQRDLAASRADRAERVLNDLQRLYTGTVSPTSGGAPGSTGAKYTVLPAATAGNAGAVPGTGGAEGASGAPGAVWHIR